MKRLSSRVGKVQMRFQIDEGMGSSEARNLAYAAVAEEFGIDEDEVRSATGQWGNVCKKQKASMSPRLIPPETPPNNNDDGNGVNEGVIDRYREWCMKYNHIAADFQLAFWTGYSRAAFAYARKRLQEDEGFEFERLPHLWGWTVVQRPPEPEPEPEPQSRPVGDLPILDILTNLPDDKKQVFHKAMVALLDALK